MPEERINTMRSKRLIAFLKESECGLMLFMISDKYFALLTKLNSKYLQKITSYKARKKQNTHNKYCYITGFPNNLRALLIIINKKQKFSYLIYLGTHCDGCKYNISGFISVEPSRI